MIHIIFIDTWYHINSAELLKAQKKNNNQKLKSYDTWCSEVLWGNLLFIYIIIGIIYEEKSNVIQYYLEVYDTHVTSCTHLYYFPIFYQLLLKFLK